MFRRLAHKAVAVANLVRGDLHRNDRVGALHRAWGHVFNSHIAGDYLEFGVYHGASFIESYRQYRGFRAWLEGQTRSPEAWRRGMAVEFMKEQAEFHGFDTFEGMPDNGEGNKRFAAGTFIADLDAVDAKCAKAFGGVAYRLHKGLFSDVNLGWSDPARKAAIVNVDGDLYASCADALRVAGPKLQIGTVLLMDDHNSFAADNSKGSRLALREFVQATGYTVEPWFAYMYAGQAFLVTAL
jgi:hypothetical protein